MSVWSRYVSFWSKTSAQPDVSLARENPSIRGTTSCFLSLLIRQSSCRRQASFMLETGSIVISELVSQLRRPTSYHVHEVVDRDSSQLLRERQKPFAHRRNSTAPSTYPYLDFSQTVYL
ncbi:uncharacterized protein LOC124722911 [Schistocerca piceifrons]|uniref:uncharacterized protein LOC124722911 n=1 Tax=Schistocerca piceifrons TaxID=274613 RepID=UPI001F5ED1AA|nr:uncharacterized protein LOC124722911 [Schistocerca piceifrons]